MSDSYPNYDRDPGNLGGGELLSALQKQMLSNGAVRGVDFLPVYGVGSGHSWPNMALSFVRR